MLCHSGDGLRFPLFLAGILRIHEYLVKNCGVWMIWSFWIGDMMWDSNGLLVIFI
jgi:hypothetical protein